MLSILAGPRQTRNLRLWTLAVSLAAVSAACDKVPLLAPPSSTIRLSSTTTNVQANGTTEIRATVLEPSGTPVQNGTTVSFSTNLGAVSPGEARTINGVATAQFVANGQSGKATLRAISGGAVSDPLELSVGAAAAGRVTVSASPTSVPASGGSTTVTAVVVDASGNPIAGVPVTFSTTAGSFSATVVNTDSTGTARTTLATNAPANVTATAGGQTSTAVNITTAAAPTVSITAMGTPSEGSVTTLSITANAGTGGAPIQKVVVNYGDGTSDDLGSVSGTVTVQHVYNDDGSFTPTVTATDTSGASATASTVIFVQPMLVTPSVTGKTDHGTTTTVDFAATVSPAGTSIASYTWNFGHGASQTTSDPTVEHEYPNTPAKTYTVRVTARSSTGHTSTGTTTVRIP